MAHTDHKNFNALAFMTTSAEYRAICVQTYRLARFALVERLEGGMYDRPCVVMDLDETVLDNSMYQAWLVSEGETFSDGTWDQWCDAGLARAVPGAVEFVLFAKACGVECVFITSRANKTRQATVDNLVRIGAVRCDEADMYRTENIQHTRLFMKGMHDFDGLVLQEEKFSQRQHIQQTRRHEILLSVGDNLGDYAGYYKKVIGQIDAAGVVAHRRVSAEERRLSADQDGPQWGVDFVVLPNPMYGDWEQSLGGKAVIGTAPGGPGQNVIVRWDKPKAP